MASQGSFYSGVFRQPQPAVPCVFVLFGATGDLAARKIAPALYNLRRDGLLSDRTAVLGVARRPRSDEQFRDEMLAAVREHSRSQPVDRKLWDQFSRRWRYHVVHAEERSEYETLRRRLDELDEENRAEGNRLFYLAMTPELVGRIGTNLGEAGLNRPGRNGGFARLVVEKPFGYDLASADELNRSLLKYFGESQICRIDHYPGKETVLNLLIFRFANAIFEPLFSRQFVDHVQITSAETIGMEDRRGPYYETTGALRDMIQNHMLQLLALTAMEAPVDMTCLDIRNEKVKVLRAIRPMTPETIAARTVRGQYGPGGDVPAYRREKGVDDNSQVETYAAVKLHLDNWRWAGVPFYLRTGKRLAAKASRILVVFKREPIGMLTKSDCDIRGSNRLAIRISPDEGINLVIDAKVPGPRMLLRPVKMDFQYDVAFGSASPEAYEHLLLDAMRGDQTLFIRNDEVDASWRFIDAIRSAWDVRGEPKLLQYAPGSWGPEQANGLFDDPYMSWQPL